MNTSKEDVINFFYPKSEGKNYWGGWSRFFVPAIPSRLFSGGFAALRSGIDSGDVADAVRFLSTDHLKRLSQSGHGNNDVLCVPTPEAKRAVQLLTSYSS